MSDKAMGRYKDCDKNRSVDNSNSIDSEDTPGGALEGLLLLPFPSHLSLLLPPPPLLQVLFQFPSQ